MNSIPWFSPQHNALVQRYNAKTLHHGILLIGKKGVGKKESLHSLSHILLCENRNACGTCQSCRLFAAGSHPDLIVPEYEKTIGVDLIRDCISQLMKKSHMGGPMVLVLHNIEAMTTASANALLKTLEEPTPNTYILMTTTSTTKLLPTILSRCEKHKVQVANSNDSEAWLQSAGVDVDPQILKLYWDRPFLLKEISNNQNLLDALQWLKSLHKVPSVQGMPATLLEEHHFVLDWMADKLSQISYSELSDILRVRIHDTWQEIIQTEQILARQGVNKLLVLEKLLQNWQQAISLT